MQKRRNDLTEEDYSSVLKENCVKRVENVGFRASGNRIVTYSQNKVGLTSNYWKRIVKEDGVSIGPLLM